MMFWIFILCANLKLAMSLQCCESDKVQNCVLEKDAQTHCWYNFKINNTYDGFGYEYCSYKNNISVICLNENPYYTENDYNILSLISIIFYFISIYLYWKYNKNNPLSYTIINILTLSVSSQILYSLINDYTIDSTICKPLGYTTYVFILATFMWITILFLKHKNVPLSIKKCYICGYIIPIITCIIIYIFDRLNYKGFMFLKPEIGLFSCWFSGLHNNLIYIYIPILIIILINFIIFHPLSKMDKIGIHYIILFSIIATSWLIQILENSIYNIDSEILSTIAKISKIIISFQGIYIFANIIIGKYFSKLEIFSDYIIVLPNGLCNEYTC